jgi:hypothetical protein
MNDTMRVAPEVDAFVAQVRARLGDLTEEEREELVGGLAADLGERLAEGEAGPAELGDPAAYAEELRVAAGLGPRWGSHGSRPGLRSSGAALVRGAGELARASKEHELGAHAWALVGALRPAWWVLRAWLVVELLDLMIGPREFLTVVPSLGNQLIGIAVLLVAVVSSALLGTGRLLPQGLGRTRAVRVCVVALNSIGALVALPWVLGSFPTVWDSHELANGSIYRQQVAGDGGQGLRSGAHYIRNVFPYDAEGRPLTGVQLFDQKGRPLGVSPESYYDSYQLGGTRVTTYSWFNGGQRLTNVFPLPVRAQQGPARRAEAWTSRRPPFLPAAPLAVVPPASLPTTTAAPTATPSGAAAGAGPSAPATPDSGKAPGR